MDCSVMPGTLTWEVFRLFTFVEIFWVLSGFSCKVGYRCFVLFFFSIPLVLVIAIFLWWMLFSWWYFIPYMISHSIYDFTLLFKVLKLYSKIKKVQYHYPPLDLVSFYICLYLFSAVLWYCVLKKLISLLGLFFLPVAV